MKRLVGVARIRRRQGYRGNKRQIEQVVGPGEDSGSHSMWEETWEGSEHRRDVT